MTTPDGTRTAPTARSLRRTALAALSLLLSLSLVPTAQALAHPSPLPTNRPSPLPTNRAVPRPPTPAEAPLAAYLRSVRSDPGRSQRFFLRLPKGGDLHNHLFGAVRTEYLIELAGDDGLCVDAVTLTAVVPPCGPGARPAVDARTDRGFHDAVLRAWSMRDFPPDRSGHDHFFATFDKFGLVASRNQGRVLAQVADSVAAQHQSYLVTMFKPAGREGGPARG
ncbi:adenosine deaminase, partial [Streptomyces sp. NPDC127079]